MTVNFEAYSIEKRNLYYKCKNQGLDYETEHKKLIEKYFKEKKGK